MSEDRKLTLEDFHGETANLIEVRNLYKWFGIKSGVFQRVTGHVKAVDGVSFKIKAGSTMGLVGESGCGKTTVGRTMLRLYPPTKGEMLYRGQNIYNADARTMRTLRAKLQMIFQDPYSSLQPRMPVGEIIGEAVREHGLVPENQLREYVLEIMNESGLQPHHIDRYPHEFSGGQRQRICIARSLALGPEFIICDEPVSALDVSIQAQIINLLMDMQEKKKLTYLFISHDLSVVEHISSHVGVMYLGSIVEAGPKEKIFTETLHPYTKALFSAIPIPDPSFEMHRQILQGDIPSPSNPPAGCKFHTRCPECMEICKTEVPEWKEYTEDHFVACHLYDGVGNDAKPLVKKDASPEKATKKTAKKKTEKKEENKEA